MSFNLKRYLEKTANYEGAQGYFVGQTRTWQNCVRLKLNAGKDAHDAWESCLKSYQKDNNSMEWIEDNVHEDSIKKSASMNEFRNWQSKIQQRIASGMAVDAAVRAVIDEFRREADGACVNDKELLENNVANNDGAAMNAINDSLHDLSEVMRKTKDKPKHPYKDQSEKKHPHSGRLDPQTDPRNFQKHYKYDGEKGL